MSFVSSHGIFDKLVKVKLEEEIEKIFSECNGKIDDKVDFFIEHSGLKSKNYDVNGTFRANEEWISKSPFKMTLMSNDEYHGLIVSNPFRALEVYWDEIIQRTHEVNLISLQRTLKWFEGVILGVQYENLFMFAASYRGLIESISDSLDALKTSNKRYERKTKKILKVKQQKIKVIQNSNHYMTYCDKELEDTLIHFTHGRDTWGEKDVPSSHKKKSFKQYAEQLEPSYSEEARKAWRELCQYTHPSALSAMVFTEPLDADYSELNVGKSHDFMIIMAITFKYRNLLSKLCEDFLASLFISDSNVKRHSIITKIDSQFGIVMANK